MSTDSNKMRRCTFVIAVMAVFASACSDQSVDLTCAEHFATGTSSLSKLGNGVAYDPGNNLHWYQCNAGQQYKNQKCTGDALNVSFNAATIAVGDLVAEEKLPPNLNWRMPTQDEYATLTDVPCHSPMVDVGVFPDVKPETFYWSGSDSNNADFACGTRLKDGRQQCRISRSSFNPTMLVAAGGD